jgi:hypothetical protein
MRREELTDFLKRSTGYFSALGVLTSFFAINIPCSERWYIYLKYMYQEWLKRINPHNHFLDYGGLHEDLVNRALVIINEETSSEFWIYKDEFPNGFQLRHALPHEIRFDDYNQTFYAPDRDAAEDVVSQIIHPYYE